MMMESFTGMIETPHDDSRSAGRLPAVAADRPALSFRPRSASLGLERIRPLPRAGARPRVRTAVSDDGGAVGVRVLPVGVLSPVRRSAVDSAARTGRAERSDAAAALCRRPALD